MIDNDQIRDLLDRHRPDRYDSSDHDWQGPVIERVAADISIAEARKRAAQQVVSNVEGVATRRTNKFIREMMGTGAFPLDWMDALAWPLAINATTRVTLRATTSVDFIEFSNYERRSAANDFATRNLTCEAALWIVDQLRDSSTVTLGEYAQQTLGSVA